MNFDRLRFVAERAELGEAREAILAVTIPERPGQLPRVLRAARQAQRHRIQLPLRRCQGRAPVRRRRGRGPAGDATELLARAASAAGSRPTTCPTTRWRSCTCATWSAATRRRATNEILYRFEFPERPGRADALPRQHERRLEHQPVPLPQPRRRLRPRAGGHAGAARRTRPNSAAFSTAWATTYVDETGQSGLPDVPRALTRGRRSGAATAVAPLRQPLPRRAGTCGSENLPECCILRSFRPPVPIPASFML